MSLPLFKEGAAEPQILKGCRSEGGGGQGAVGGGRGKGKCDRRHSRRTKRKHSQDVALETTIDLVFTLINHTVLTTTGSNHFIPTTFQVNIFGTHISNGLSNQ